MKSFFDVVNFNADASCLDSRDWLEILNGGEKSRLCQWLSLYITHQKPVILGFPGATISDIVCRNPEAIRLINNNTDIFEVLLRPFAHDLGLLRTSAGFKINYQLGERVIRREFINVANYFLPPEFMLTNEQLHLLCEGSIVGLFTNPDRFSEDIRERMPSVPYRISGIFGSSLLCLPFKRSATQAYLKAIQLLDISHWNSLLDGCTQSVLFSWRDGESSFFLPNGLEREEFWLKNQSKAIHRRHLGLSKHCEYSDYNVDTKINHVKCYPVHSFLGWMRELRMLGFVNRINLIEAQINNLSVEQQHYWLLVINSDILSSVEKSSPIVNIRTTVNSLELKKHQIFRSERWLEGEEYLALLEKSLKSETFPLNWLIGETPGILKWKQRISYLSTLK
jgi:hypothetical protein